MRAKRSSQRWLPKGISAVLALRSLLESERLAPFWNLFAATYSRFCERRPGRRASSGARSRVTFGRQVRPAVHGSGHGGTGSEGKTAGTRREVQQRMLRLGFGLGGLVLAGCATFVEATALNPPPRALTPRPPESVEIFASSPPARPYVDVASLDVHQTEYSAGGEALMLETLRARAGEMGCDALFITGTSRHEGDPDLFFLDPDSRSVHATCIVYPDPAAPASVTASGRPGG